MVKVVSFFKRKPGLGVETFQAYWRTEHAKLVARLPGLRRYVQSHTRLSGYRMREPPYDGVAEVWFDGPDLAPALRCTPEYAAVRSDERNFIDPTTFGTIVTDEHVIKDGPAPSNGVKNIEFVSRRTGMPTERFQEYWRTVHGPLGAAIPVVLRYVQCHTRPSAYRTGQAAAYDGVALTWFSDTAAMRKSATLPEYDAVRADEPNFIDCGKLTFIIATEHTIVSLD